VTSPADYVMRGWKIFPCHSIQRGRCTCPDGLNCLKSPGKHPLTEHGHLDASNDINDIRAWEARWPWANWAVATGRINDLVVIDIDPRNGGYQSVEEYEILRPDGPLPYTLQSITGGGGKHLFYAYPPNIEIKSNKSRWLKGVDIKAEGGYVMLPEAQHISGLPYRWVNWLDQYIWLPPDVAVQLSKIGSASLDGPRGDLAPTSEILKGVPLGERDDVLFREACRLRRQLGDDGRSAVEILILEAARNCSPPFPDSEALRKVEQAWQQDHTDSFIDWAERIKINTGISHDLTDLGNAKRFVDQFGQDVLYVGGWGWLTWTDIGWQRDSHGSVAERAHFLHELITAEARQLEAQGADPKTVSRYMAWSKRSQSHGTMSACLKVLESMSVIRRSAEDFDNDDNLLVCRDKIVDLRTGEWRPINRSDLVTKNTNVAYDPTYRLPEWERFLWEATDGDQETIDYLQRAVGYTLTGSNPEEALWLISGPPASGKSTFIDGCHAALGSYAATTQADTFMWHRGQNAPLNDLALLAGCRLVSVTEVKQGEGFNESLIKAVTGDARITARFLYENTFVYRPQFALWIGTNHDPQARDDGLWRRIKKIKFPNAVPPERRDPGLKAIIRDPEKGGRAVLAWAVRGAMAWYRDGLRQPMSVTTAVYEYHQDQDQMQQFITECLQRQDGANTLLNTIYAAYRIWCGSVGIYRPLTRQMFAKSMEDKGFKTILDDWGRESYLGIVALNAIPTWTP
jgi:putative DNA primase/helicase